MMRTRIKSKTENPSASTRNVGTQTPEFDSEITQLQEQLKLLQLQYDALKQHMKTPNKSGTSTQYKRLYTQESSKSNATNEKHNCNCKGNCSSRVCGCVKKDNKCSSSCKCNNKICQNQELKDENKENANKNDMETPKKQNTKNEATNKNLQSLFSPDQTYKDLEETQISNIHFNFNNKNDTMMKNLQTDKTSKTNTVTSKKERKNKEQQQLAAKIVNDITDNTEITATNNVSSNNENVVINEMFDPMKPKHQLSRTPPNNKKVTNESPEMENIIEPQPHHESNKNKKIISSIQVLDIKEEKVDWQEHTAQLVPCKKCKRTFMPYRIQKHEACCKGNK
ncbi:uncharacterized protein [Anoplolepis gracilipes]|uniref:uncharacterized protein isoform X2 n=1 Tax=Anoplolepis gracilipes TaxID=354296 RepID=UPI003B9F1718